MTHTWNYLPITPEQEEVSQHLAQELGISPILCRLLAERGIQTAAALFIPRWASKRQSMGLIPNSCVRRWLTSSSSGVMGK